MTQPTSAAIARAARIEARARAPAVAVSLHAEKDADPGPAKAAHPSVSSGASARHGRPSGSLAGRRKADSVAGRPDPAAKGGPEAARARARLPVLVPGEHPAVVAARRRAGPARSSR